MEVNRKRKNIVKGPNLKEIGYDVSRVDHRYHLKKQAYILIIILFILILLFIVFHFMIPIIKLNGSSKIEINYNDTYVESGATAKFLNKNLTDKIVISSNIDTSKVGNYHVVYTVSYGFYKVKKIRMINVVDKNNPTIELSGGSDVNICPNTNFEELGYKATDDYDGDITDKVKVKKSGNKIIYTVEDSSKNSFSITRKINKVDDVAPVITLKGNSTMYLGLDDTFTEPGYTVSDNCSTDLTNRVKVSGEVISKVKGVYTLTYEVTDDGNNKATVERKVIVSDKTDPNSGILKKGAIYLTFDDGPSSVTTSTILDILKEENVKATFFVTNNGPDSLIKRIYDEGHTIAIHTASHTYSKVYASVDAYFDDLKIVSDRIKRITGQTTKIVRFPGGSSNTISRRYCSGIMTKLSEELFSRGYRYYDWNVDSNDASTSKNKQAVYNNVTKNLSKNRGNVVLMHDIKTQTRDALRDIIKYGKENGYTFEKIDMDTYMVRQHINN